MIKQLITGIFAFFMLAMISSNASAVATFAEMQNGAQSMTISEGDTVYFDVGIFSVNPPMTYSIKMYQNGNLVSTFKDNIQDSDGWYSERIYIGEDEYGQVGGAFQIIISSEDAETSDYYTLTLNVNGVNDSPSIAMPDITAEEGTLYSIDLDDYATDADNADSELTFEVYAYCDVTIDPITHVATFDLPLGYTGDFWGNVWVQDPDGAFSISFFTITATPANGLNILSVNAPSSIKEGQTLDVSFTAADSDGDPLTYYIYKNGALVSSTNSYSWKTGENDAGTYSFDFIVIDAADGLTDTESRTVVVQNVASLGKPSLDVEIQPVYFFGNAYLKLRNRAMAIEDLEITASIPEIGYEETINVNIERNEVKQIELNVPQDNAGTYIMEIKLEAEDYDALRYAVVEI